LIQLTPQMRILLAVEPADFRRGIDGLARMCREALGVDPFSGAVFVYRNRRGTALKLLLYDGQGFWLCQKRLSTGKFRWWPKPGHEAGLRLAVHELQLLLWNGNPALAQTAPPWRPVAAVE
jgi:transposase